MNIFVMAKKAIAKALGIEPPKQLPPWWYVDEGSSQLLRPSQLAEILDGNDVVAKARLWETIETRDAVVHSCLQTRKLAVSGKPWEIVPASEKRKDRKIAQFVREVFENIEDFDSNKSIFPHIIVMIVNRKCARGIKPVQPLVVVVNSSDTVRGKIFLPPIPPHEKGVRTFH